MTKEEFHEARLASVKEILFPTPQRNDEGFYIDQSAERNLLGAIYDLKRMTVDQGQDPVTLDVDFLQVCLNTLDRVHQQLVAARVLLAPNDKTN